MAEKVFALEEIVKHNNRLDCWLIISGKVYDVTPYLIEHPGGDDVMIMASGKEDATNDFEDVGHSNDAREKMKEYYIGDVDESSLPVKQQFISPPPPPPEVKTRDSGDVFKISLFILPLFILGVAFLFRFYFKTE